MKLLLKFFDDPSETIAAPNQFFMIYYYSWHLVLYGSYEKFLCAMSQCMSGLWFTYWTRNPEILVQFQAMPNQFIVLHYFKLTFLSIVFLFGLTQLLDREIIILAYFHDV